MKGSIKLFIGCMFSSKTSSMCNEVEKYHIANKLCVIVKFAADTRYDSLATHGGVVTHAGREHHKIPIVRASRLTDVFDEISEYEIIGVDETQFFPDNVEVLQRLANMGKIVIAAGLDGNYLGKPFGRMAEIFPIAEEIIKLKAVCMKCCADASFTQRIAGGDQEVEIGGADKYLAVCRSCMWEGAEEQIHN